MPQKERQDFFPKEPGKRREIGPVHEPIDYSQYDEVEEEILDHQEDEGE